MSTPSPLEAIYFAALEKGAPAERAAYLDAACGGDPVLRGQVEKMLVAEAQAGSFLEVPVGVPDKTIGQSPLERAGTLVGPYKLLEEIGEGGMGTVYMAEQKLPVERRVALKVIKPGMDTQQVIARFEAERQALAMMDHPNIARVLDAGTTDSGRPYFVMELVNGIPVTQFCDEQHLTARERLELFIPICQAVQHAHQKGIIHRDIKPSNILVALYDGRPVPKIIDFGVAKATSQPLTEKTMFTGLGQIVGTLEYMSPEQAQRNQLDIDTRSDVYSLGVVLYELLTGATPFDKQRLRSAAIDELLRIIREEEPPKPSTKLSSSDTLPSVAANRQIEPAKLTKLVRGELDWIVMKALEKDRTRRYETASALATDIAHYLNDEPVVACPPSAAYRFRKFARRNKAVILTTVLVVASLVLGLIGISWQAIRAMRAETAAIAERDEKEAARRGAEAAGLAEAEQRREAEAQRKLADEQREQAVAQRQIARQEELTARRRLYTSQMNLIYQAAERTETGRALALLERQRPEGEQPDLRGFEWYCLWRLCHQGHRFTLRGHQNRVASVAFSPDGRTLASGSWDGTVKLWDTATGQVRATIPGTNHEIKTVAFSPDGKLLASASQDGTINLWEPGTGRERATWQAHLKPIESVTFSPDGQALASGSADETVKLWDTTSGREKTILHEKFKAPVPLVVNSVAMSPDGKTLAAGGNDWRNLRIWDTTTGQLRFVLYGHMLSVFAVAFSPDGQTLASGGYDQTVKLWDVATGKLATTLDNQAAKVLSLAFSPDGITLAAGTSDGTVTLWDFAAKQKRPNLLGHRAAVRSVAFSPDGKILATAGDDKIVKLWDVSAADSPTIVPGGSGVAWSLAFSPDGKELAFSSDRPFSVKLWDLGTGQVRLSLGKNHALGLAYSPDGKTLAATRHEELRFFNLSTASETVVPPASSWGVAFSPDGTLLASGSHDHTVKLWDVVSGREQNSLKGHSDWVGGVKFSPDGKTLASASHDRTVKLWDVATREERATLRGHADLVWSLAYLPDGRTLVSGGGDIKVWDVNTATERLTLKGDVSSARSAFIAASPDGKTLASASSDGLTFWDTAAWYERATFKWHRASIRTVTFSPDSRMLATGAEDGTVKLWRAATEEEVVAQSSVSDGKERTTKNPEGR